MTLAALACGSRPAVAAARRGQRRLGVQTVPPGGGGDCNRRIRPHGNHTNTNDFHD